MTATRLCCTTLITAFSLGSIASVASPQNGASSTDLSGQVEIRRTTHGVPHIRAQNLVAANYALAYVMLEDYGPRVAMGLLRGRGEMGKWFGRDSMDGDFGAQRDYALAVQNYRSARSGHARGVRGVRGWGQPIHRAPPERVSRRVQAELHGLRRCGEGRDECVAGGHAALHDSHGARKQIDAPLRRPPTHRTKGSTPSKKDRMHGRSLRAERSRGGRSCFATRTSHGALATTKRT